MENELYKSRSFSACIKAAYLLFSNNIKTIFCRTWLPVLIMSLALAGATLVELYFFGNPSSFPFKRIFGLVQTGTILISFLVSIWYFSSTMDVLNDKGKHANLIKSMKLALVYIGYSFVILLILTIVTVAIFKCMVTGPATLPKFAELTFGTNTILLLIILLLSIPFVYFAIKYMMEDFHIKQGLYKSYKTGLNNWGLLFGTMFFSKFIVGIIFSIIGIPLFILVSALIMSLNGEVNGDPSGIPAYFPYLIYITSVIISFIMLYAQIWVLFTSYYAYGSIEAKEKEKEKAEAKSIKGDILEK